MPCMQANFQRKGHGWQWFETHFAICWPGKIHDVTKGWRKKGSSVGRQMYAKGEPKSVIPHYFITLMCWYGYLHAHVSHDFRRSSPASEVELWELKQTEIDLKKCQWNWESEGSKWRETDSRWLKAALRMYGDANGPDTTWEMTANPSETSSSLHLYDKQSIITTFCIYRSYYVLVHDALQPWWLYVPLGINLSNATFCQMVLQSHHAVVLAYRCHIQYIAKPLMHVLQTCIVVVIVILTNTKVEICLSALLCNLVNWTVY